MLIVDQILKIIDISEGEHFIISSVTILTTTQLEPDFRAGPTLVIPKLNLATAMLHFTSFRKLCI